MITVLNKTNSIFNTFLAETRDEQIQKDSSRFRKNMERMGSIIGYEISKQFNYSVQTVNTPLGIAEENTLSNHPVIVSVLRAGLPIHQGVLNIFDAASGGFISIYRNYDKESGFQIKVECISCPSIEGKTVILCDALIATGASMSHAYRSLLTKGTPKEVHIISLIASNEGLNHLRKSLPKKGVHVWLGALDDELTVQSYIVPGLGDAGDLAFGEKEQLLK